jgi:mono/diheme cytochrome c family protein
MFRIIIFGIIAVFVLIQFIPVTMDNPPVQANFDGPTDVEEVFRQSCYDCHSNETVWPWYSRIAPVSWLVAGHVNEGRHRLDFSEWGVYSDLKRARLAEGIGEEVEEGEMPLAVYLIMHSSAELDERDIATIESWLAGQNPDIPDDNEE